MTQDAELKTLVDVNVRALPRPRAPQTLLPRVMAAVQAWAARPWYRRAWFTWPRGGQLAAVASLVLVAAALFALLPVVLGPLAPAVSARILDRQRELAALAEYAVIVTEVGAALWRTTVEPIAGYLFALSLLMCLACAALCTALNHAMFQGMSER